MEPEGTGRMSSQDIMIDRFSIRGLLVVERNSGFFTLYLIYIEDSCVSWSLDLSRNIGLEPFQKRTLRIFYEELNFCSYSLELLSRTEAIETQRVNLGFKIGKKMFP